MVKADPMPAAVAAARAEQIVELDVREELRTGREPFSLIMAALRQLPADGVLRLRAIFEPVPLYAVLSRQGFAHWTEQLAPDDWAIWFFPGASAPAGQAAGAPASTAEAGGVVVLDVRGLEPPEPLLQTLEQLDRLPAGGTLVQVNERVPQFLLPQLRARGFSWEIVEEGGVVRVFIRRETETGAGHVT